MYMHNAEHHRLFQVTPNQPICTLVVSSSGKAQLKQSKSGVARHQGDTDAPAVLYMTVRHLPIFPVQPGLKSSQELSGRGPKS